MSSREALGDCGKAGSRASRGSTHAGVGASMIGSGCEDAAIVLVWDTRQASLFANGAREINRHDREPANASVEKPTWETGETNRRHWRD